MPKFVNLRARSLCVAVLCVAANVAMAAPPAYRVKPVLPPEWGGNTWMFWYDGLSLNNEGKIVTIAHQANVVYRSYAVYDKDGKYLRSLGGPTKYGDAWFSGINRYGDVVGSSAYAWSAWAGVVSMDQGFGAAVHGFPDDEYGGYFTDAFGYGLSDNGYVVGWATSSVDQRHRGYVRQPDNSMLEIGTFGGPESDAYAVNNHGVAVGAAELADGSHHAFAYRQGVMKDLGTFGGPSSWAADINDAGQVVGAAQLADGTSRAFLYEKGQMKQIPTPEGASASAAAINRHGWVLGSYTIGDVSTPFLYDGEVVYPVADLLPATERKTWTLRSVMSINDKGWLLADGYQAGDVHDTVLLLKPAKAQRR